MGYLLGCRGRAECGWSYAISGRNAEQTTIRTLVGIEGDWFGTARTASTQRGGHAGPCIEVTGWNGPHPVLYQLIPHAGPLLAVWRWIQHPPATLARLLVRYSHEAAMQREVVPHRVLHTVFNQFSFSCFLKELLNCIEFFSNLMLKPTFGKLADHLSPIKYLRLVQKIVKY